MDPQDNRAEEFRNKLTQMYIAVNQIQGDVKRMAESHDKLVADVKEHGRRIDDLEDLINIAKYSVGFLCLGLIMAKTGILVFLEKMIATVIG